MYMLGKTWKGADRNHDLGFFNPPHEKKFLRGPRPLAGPRMRQNKQRDDLLFLILRFIAIAKKLPIRLTLGTYFSDRWARDGPKTGPSWTRDDPSWLGPRWALDGPRCRQDGQKMGQVAPRSRNERFPQVLLGFRGPNFGSRGGRTAVVAA